jgi:beta-glucanase (GH16 family)
MRRKIWFARLGLVLAASALSFVTACGTEGSSQSDEDVDTQASAVKRRTLTVLEPLKLDRTVVRAGETLTGTVAYRNATSVAIGLQRLVIAVRGPGGAPVLDLVPQGGPRTVQPGEVVRLTASRTWQSSDPLGTHTAFSTYQDSSGAWIAAPSLTFEVSGASTAPVPTTGTAVVEADTMTRSNTSATVRARADATGGQSVLMTGPSTISTSLTTGRLIQLSVRTGTYIECPGSIRMRVLVDGVARIDKALSYQWALQDHTAAVDIAAGTHTVAVEFVSGATCYDELWVDTVSLVGESTGTTPAPAPSGWALKWADEFNTDGAPNPAWWTPIVKAYEFGTDNYWSDRPQNVRVENGNLVLEARLESYGGRRYTSGAIWTKGKVNFMYGRLEARALLPTGRGVWPAFWTLGQEWNSYADWPASGEIDVMEYVGHDPFRIHGTIHSTAYNHEAGTAKGGSITVSAPWLNWHVYAVEWFPDRIDFFVDGAKYFTFYKDANATNATWPFSKNHFVILNLSIGGSWGGEQGIDDTIFPHRYLVDYVRYYERTP